MNKTFAPNMLLVGSTARNTGKTTFCTQFIRKWESQHDIVGVKLTTIHGEEAHCHHGDEGCGACTSFRGDYEIIEERDASAGKDTSLLLDAGAVKVFWVRAKADMLEEAVKQCLAAIPNDVVIVCESNSLRDLVIPGAVVVTHRSGITEMKPSAKPMLDIANVIIDIANHDSIETAIARIDITSNGEVVVR